jgi:hypothetical protein
MKYREISNKQWDVMESHLLKPEDQDVMTLQQSMESSTF